MMLAELLDVVTLTTRPPAVNSHTSAPLGVFLGDTTKSRVTGGEVFFLPDRLFVLRHDK